MNQPPTALLLITSSCPHCPAMLQSMSELIKEGRLASFEVINITNVPAKAAALNVRSVPWLKLGEFELSGLKSKKEILQWIDKTRNSTDMSAYFEELMTSGEISKVLKLVEDKPQQITTLFNIMADETTSLSARIGVGAIIEDIAANNIFTDHIEELGEYCQHPSPRVRNDVCYYLGLSRRKTAMKYLQPLLKDEDSEVREVAQEALLEINNFLAGESHEIP